MDISVSAQPHAGWVTLSCFSSVADDRAQCVPGGGKGGDGDDV